MVAQKGEKAARRSVSIFAIASIGFMAACATVEEHSDQLAPLAPGVDTQAQSEISGLDVGARLMAAGEYEAAIDSFHRAAIEEGVTPDVLVALGGANLGLGRLGQAEDMFRRAIEIDDSWPEPWNNLGVVMMERNQPSRAVQMFRRAYALDNGESDAIRANLLMAEAQLDEVVPREQENTPVIRRASGDILLQTQPNRQTTPSPVWLLADVGRTAPSRPNAPSIGTVPTLALDEMSALSDPVLTAAETPRP